MILLDEVSKSYPIHGGGRREVLRDVSIALPHGRNIGILGGNGAGKSTLLRLIAGSEPPDRGRVRRTCRVSFPLGFTGTFHGGLSGRENATFLARIYGADPRAVLDFVHDFAELGPYLDMPVETYSAGMSARLAFGLTLAIDFDVYLVDEITEVGDARFRAKSARAFRERLGRSSVILVSHSSTTIRALCDCCAILSGGALHPYETVEDGMAAYAALMGVADA
ncbi:ABC transporter ATP-binding protein [Muricoccus radiodurans]|uniref:ABC transporter ATP-binding protein n=1 Tax=Muricoccus radiodurans TaxID=2231721 RepID=UPI003CF9F754